MIVKLQNSRRFVSSCTRGDEQQQERHEAAGAREEAQQQPEVADLVRQESGQRGREDEEDGDDGIHDGSLLYGHTWGMIWAMKRCLRFNTSHLPRDFMWRLMYGYRTVIEADWKRNTSLMQIRCRILNKDINIRIQPELQMKVREVFTIFENDK